MPADQFSRVFGDSRARAHADSLLELRSICAEQSAHYMVRLVGPGEIPGPLPADQEELASWRIEFYDHSRHERSANNKFSHLGEPLFALAVAEIREYIRGMAVWGPMLVGYSRQRKFLRTQQQEWLLSEAALAELNDWLSACGAPETFIPSGASTL